MTLRIGMEASEWSEILNSLSKVARGEEEISLDLNLVAREDNSVRIYVRNYDTLQVMHKIKDEADVTVDVSQSNEFVFDSQILQSVVQDAGDKYIELNFGEHEFKVIVSQESFTGPATFDLHLVQDSEFQEPTNVGGFESICQVSRRELRSNLKMFSSVSKIVEFNVAGNVFSISVADKVQGSGGVEEELEDPTSIAPLSAKYPIRPIKDFLSKMKTDEVTIALADHKTVRLRSETRGRVSEIIRAERL